MEMLEQCVGCFRGWQWRDQDDVISAMLVSLLSALGVVGALFWCFCCWIWASKCWLGISNFNDRFLLTNDIFDWFIYFLVIFCSIRLFFTVSITNFNNYLIHIMKLQLFMLLWSGLKSPLVLGSHFVVSSQFIYIAGSLAGFDMMRVFCWWGFSNKF